MADMTPHIWMLVFGLVAFIMVGQAAVMWWHRRALIAGVTDELRKSARPGHGASAEAIVMVIDQLREDEGSSVTIFADNADFNGGPDRLIICNGDWTGWRDRHFGGDTLFQALADARKAKEAANGKA